MEDKVQCIILESKQGKEGITVGRHHTSKYLSQGMRASGLVEVEAGWWGMPEQKWWKGHYHRSVTWCELSEPEQGGAHTHVRLAQEG